MARIRTIKPEFWTDEELSSIPAESALLAIALLNYADDEGYFKAHPGLVRAGCMPLRDTSGKVSEMLQELVGIGYIRIGTGSDGKKYGQVINFLKHQRISHPSPSAISRFSITWDRFRESSGISPEGSVNPPETLRPEMEMEREMEREMEEEREMEGECKGETMHDPERHENETRQQAAPASRTLDSVSDEFEIFWTQYPRRHGTNPKQGAFKRWSSRIRDGTRPDEMISGAMRYAQHCDAKRITGTEFVMQAARFLGPDEHYRDDWRKPNGTACHLDPNDRPF
jgi:hypothetical protein